MQQFNAREIVNWSYEEIAAALNDAGRIELMFDDGPMVVGGRYTIISWFYWQFHREYPALHLTKDHHIGSSFSNGRHLDMLTMGLRGVFRGGLSADMFRLTQIVMEIVDALYNILSIELEPYVTTITPLDYLELIDHPEIKKAKENTSPRQNSIEQCYREVERVIMTCPTLKNNAVAKACRGNLISTEQVLQAVAMRGFVTDFDSHIFPKPLMNGYAEGMVKLHDSMTVSREATLAQNNNGDALKDTETLNRLIQLQNMVIKSMIPGDCGTNKTVEFHVTKKSLRNLQGKHFVNEAGILETITTDSKHLVGKVVKLRSPLTCRHRNDYKLCECCAGELIYNVVNEKYYGLETNIGHASAVAMCAFISQSILSTKHLNRSSTAESVTITEREAPFIRNHKEDPCLMLFNKPKQGERWIVKVQEDHIKHLEDIKTFDDVNKLSARSLLEFDMFSIEKRQMTASGKEIVTEEIINASVGQRLSTFTYEFLAFIQRTGWEVDEWNAACFDITGWTYNVPAITVERKHYNMFDYMKAVRSFMQGSQDSKVGQSVSNCKTPEEALRKLYDLINSRGNIHVYHLEVVLLAAMITSRAQGIYTPPSIDIDEVEFAGFKENFFNGSMGGAMAFGYHEELLNRAEAYDRNVPDHALDHLLHYH